MRFSTEGWEWLGGFLEGRGLPGIAVAVTDENDTVSFDSAGWAELRRRPIDETTLFELGSIGKTFTAVVALQLVREGLLELGAPVTDYLPWFEVRSAYGPIAVEHLLTHSAGLIRGADMTADSRFDVWALRGTDVGFPAGERHYYSNVGYRALGYALEEATGLRYRDLLLGLVLEPLGLEHTEPAITTDMRGRLAVGYDRLHDDRPPEPDDPLYPAPWLETGTADGSLASTAEDLAAFARFLLAGETKRLTSGRLLDCGDGWSYGYGLESKVADGRRLFRHGGSMPGFASTMLGDLDSGLAAVVLMNGPDERGATEAVAEYALDLQRGAEPDPPGEAAEDEPESRPAEPREEWAAFYGRYRSYNPWLPGFRIVQRESGLTAACSWGDDKPLVPLGAAEFRVGAEDWSPERLSFEAVVDGTALRANLSGESYYRSDFE